MTYYLGVDLGTTFTSAGVFRDGWVATAALSNHEASTKSVVFAKEDGTILTGDTAARRGVTDPERVGREFKRRLGDPQPLFLGGSPYSAEQLTSRLLRFVLDQVDKAEGESPAGVAISHPANWGPYKVDLLRQAVQMAGLSDSTVFLAEPEAAAIYYAEDARLQPGQTIAVYDLGGGTFDAAVLRKTKDGFEFLGPPVGIERLGGIDFDAAVFAHVTRELGDRFTSLDPEDPAAIAGVARLREDCTLAREGLSDDNTVTIPVLLPGVSAEVRITRSEYEAMIRPGLAETVSALERALAGANVQVTDLHAVLLVGGCSRTPLVAQMISSELGCPIALCPDLIHAVALGGAHAAARAATPQAEAQAPVAPAVPATPPTPPIPASPVAPTTAAAPIASPQPPPERLATPVAPAPVAPASVAAPQVPSEQLPVSAEWAAPSASMPTPAPLFEEVTSDKRRIGALVGAGFAVLAVVGIGLFLNSRGDAEETETAVQVEVDSAPDPDVQSATTVVGVTEEAANLIVATVDKGSMVGIDVADPLIGTNAERSQLSPPEFAPERTVDGQITAFVDRNVTNNVQFYDFATFTSVVADGDPLETWLSLVPESWLVNTAELPTNFADLGIPAQEPVIGVSWATADRYCNYALKRMPTEIEWELAAADGLFDFSSSQNWVSESEVYGSIPSGATVARGSSSLETVSAYHRTISPGGDGLPDAGIRCAADGVNEIARPSGELIYSRIFGGDEEPRDWPDLHDPDNTDVVFGYHSPDVFHIETVAATSTVVSSGETHTDNTEVSMQLDLRKPKQAAGTFRYGLLTRASVDGALLFLVSPNTDSYGGSQLEWCVKKPDWNLIEEGWIYGIEPSYDTGCVAEGIQPVESFLNNISVRFVDGTAQFFIEEDMVGDLVHGLKLDGEFGVVLEAFEGDPKVHIHYDNLVVKTS